MAADKAPGRMLHHVLRLALAICLWLAQAGAPLAQSDGEAGPLLDRLTPEVIEAVFPGITHVAMVEDEGPVAAEAFRGEEMAGYIFSTLDVLRAPGYSSTPFDVVAGVAMDGRVTGAVVLFHREPYLLNDNFRTGRLVTFLDALAGVEGRLGSPGGMDAGFVSGATISARAMRNAVLEGAGMVLGYRSELVVVTEPTIDTLNFRPLSPEELVQMGALARIRLTNADLAARMAAAGLTDLLPEVAMYGGAGDLYADIVFGYANPPKIGRNGVSAETFDQLVNGTPEGTMAIYFGSLGGVFDHRGTRYNNLSSGLLLERVSVTQNGRTWWFTKPEVIFSRGRIADLLLLPDGSGFDPMQPWSAEVHAAARRPDGSLTGFSLGARDYSLPAELILLPPPELRPVWLEPWIEGRVQIAVLCLALAALTAILAFQGALTRRRKLHRWVRDGFLLFTLVWIGWIASAQLSIVHVVNYLKAPFSGLGLAFYLAEPLIVILSVYTALSLLLLGRGVFCGWLCPFGALQELLAKLGRALKLPVWNPSDRLQRKLWMGKYVSLALIIVLVFALPDAGITATAQEIEPFKTAITAMFVRGLPYVLWALLLLAIGLFTERAFCRFLCPLGASLAILDRLHLLNLLKRRPECGNPCHLCERSCPVRAIAPSGKIVMAECFQCLDCMVEYHDDRRCPPLAKIRKQLERAKKAPAAKPAAMPVAARAVP